MANFESLDGNGNPPGPLISSGPRSTGADGGSRAGMPLSRNDQSLQPPVYELPATFESAGAAGGHELELFVSIVDQFPRIARVVLHASASDDGPRSAADDPLSQGSRHLCAVQHQRNAAPAQALARAHRCRVDELRVSLDAAEPKAFELVRGRDVFYRIVRNVGLHRPAAPPRGCERPKVSLWLTGLKETVAQLPAFVRLAHELGVGEVYLQRLVYFPTARAWRAANPALYRAAR